MEQRDFFISYTHTNKVWAEWVADVLKRNGYSVYYQEQDIPLGDNFIKRMNEFLKNSDNFLAIWSEAYSKSRFCMTEFEAAFNQWHQGRMNCFLTVRIEPHQMEPLYATLVHADLSDMGAASEKTLVDAVRSAVPLPLTNTWSEEAEMLYQRGKNYYYGLNGVQQHIGRAREYYEEAAELGHVPALNTLGYLYIRLPWRNEDYITALRYFQQAAEKGNADALFNLGLCYAYSEGVEQDYDKAREYYEQAAEKGSAVALCELGDFYEQGLGDVKQNSVTARKYYRQAAERGDSHALIALGRYYLDGAGGVKQNETTARRHFQRAADQGNTEGLIALGRYYLDGGNLGITFKKYVRQAVEGDTEAKEALARYMNDLKLEDLKPDYTAARKCFEQAADQGNTEAMTELAKLYINALGVERDYDKARNYVQQAIDHGDDDALGMLSLFYEHGWGVEQDSEKAYELERDSDMRAKDSWSPPEWREFRKKLRR